MQISKKYNNTIIIIKLKDADTAKSIEDKITKRVQNQAVRFKDYLPNEYFIIQKNVIDIKGDYILFVISKDADKIASLFDGFFK